MGLEISTVSSERELGTFLRVSALIRPENHVNKIPGRWVRPLLDRRKNPYFRHADHALLLARRDGQVVGRVALFVDHLCNRILGERVGSFGLFDCIHSPRIASNILDAAQRWLENHGATVIRGPAGPAMRLGTGLLIQGHGEIPMPGMTFDPPELGPLIESAGYQVSKDLHAYRLNTRMSGSLIAERADEVRRRRSLMVRPFNQEAFGADIQRIRTVINDLPSLGRACSPWTEDEVRWMAKKLWLLLDPMLVLIVEHEGEPVAMGLALRNVREALGGRSPRSSVLDSIRVARALRTNQLSTARITLLAVRNQEHLPKLARKDLMSLILVELLGRLRLFDVSEVEISLVDPTDSALLGLLDEAGAAKYKTYRIYEKRLREPDLAP